MKRISSNIFTFLYVIIIPFLLLDVYKSRTTSLTYFHISSREIAVWSIILLIFLRIFSNQLLNTKIAKLNTYFILPVTFILGVLLTIWDYFTPSNYVFSLTYLQYTQIFYISIFSAIVWFSNHPKKWFAKNYSKVLFFGSISYLIVAFIISLFPRDIFAKLSQEDHFIENTQVIILLLGAFWAFRLARHFVKSSKFHALLFLIATGAFIFIAGDEISWGQRILHLTTPTELTHINRQNEITVHNISFFEGYVGLSYMLIGLYGASAWIVQSFVPKLKKIPIAYYIPPWFCSIFFFSGFAYNFYTATHIDPFIGVWSESAELMLYSGMAFTMLSLLFWVNKKKTDNKIPQLPFK